ncbi:hypothetical protein GIB67_018734, partial [Kingdonia uniflora]
IFVGLQEAYEKFKHVLLALIYGKDDQASPVANENLLFVEAIASMMRAQDVDPKNLEVLLALGVSHTNELEQAVALKYLYGWLQNHPKYGTIAHLERSNSLYYADAARLFNEAAQISADDADVHIVLGVLYNLSREYDKAIGSFQTALKLKPQDNSLWNKLGTTQANSIQSTEAISAYQQAVILNNCNLELFLLTTGLLFILSSFSLIHMFF